MGERMISESQARCDQIQVRLDYAFGISVSLGMLSFFLFLWLICSWCDLARERNKRLTSIDTVENLQDEFERHREAIRLELSAHRNEMFRDQRLWRDNYLSKEDLKTLKNEIEIERSIFTDQLQAERNAFFKAWHPSRSVLVPNTSTLEK